MKTGIRVLAVLALASLAGGCGKTPTTASTVTGPAQRVVFTSTLVPRGAAAHGFTITQSGPIAITMSNVPASVVGLGFGIPDATSPLGCSLTTTVVAGSDTNPQISSSANAGAYCLEIYDVGNLTIPISFYITLDSGGDTGTSTTTPPTPTVTEDFAGTLDIGGTSFYPFTVSTGGVVNVTLNSVTGAKVPPSVALNVGIGTFADGVCTPATAKNVQVGMATPQLTTTLAAGASCVQVADVGNLVSPATFDISIVHP